MLTTFIQETPCKSIPATCMGPTEYKCVPGMQKLSEFSAGSNVVREIKPGSPAVCGHGNREFSFLARRGKLTTHVMVVFLGGGICWDAETCAAEGAGRTISMDSLHSRNPDSSPAVPFEVKQDLGTPGKAFRLGIFDSASTELDNPFTRWSLLVIPDCTGDQHIGNRSYTYDAGKETCRTVHHRGGVNTGMAMDWFFESFPVLEQVLVLGIPLTEHSKSTGSHGAAFWGKYIQDRAPSAKVRVVIDSSMAVFGPKWRDVMMEDPWGTANLVKPPPAVTNSKGGVMAHKENAALVLPPRSEWTIGEDDMLSYYEWVVHRSPQLVFVDLSSTDDDVQIALFELLGGRQRACCMDGCACSEGESGDKTYYGNPDHIPTPGGVYWLPWKHVTKWDQATKKFKPVPPSGSIHEASPSIESLDPRHGLGLAGALDWTKKRKIEVLRKHRRLPHNYRALLLPGNRRGLVTENGAFRTACPQFLSGESVCDQAFVVKEWVKAIADSEVELDGQGKIVRTNLVDADDYRARVFGLSTCAGCLDGILGSGSMSEELCNSTLPPGFTLLKIAPRFRTTWLALWSLNGGTEPDVSEQGRIFRFGHELHLAAGDSLADLATRMGTTVEQIVDANDNRLTHIQNAQRLGEWANTRVHMCALVDEALGPGC